VRAAAIVVVMTAGVALGADALDEYVQAARVEVTLDVSCRCST
jgi:hypothetical protein